MQRDPRAFLWDVKESATQIQTFVAGMDAPAYAANAMAHLSPMHGLSLRIRTIN